MNQTNYRKLSTAAAIKDLDDLERQSDLPALRSVVLDSTRSPVIRAIALHKATRLASKGEPEILCKSS